MVTTGQVMSVREGSFNDKQTGKPVPMLYVDLYDETVREILNLSVKLEGGQVIPQVNDKISADVTGIRPSNFGKGGFNITVKNIRSANGTGATPPPPVKK